MKSSLLKNCSAKAKLLLPLLPVAGVLCVYLLPEKIFLRGPTVCLFKRFLQTECPGCGLTRAFYHIFHGNFSSALDCSKLSWLVFGAFLIFTLHWEWKTIKKLWFAEK